MAWTYKKLKRLKALGKKLILIGLDKKEENEYKKLTAEKHKYVSQALERRRIAQKTKTSGDG